jgi:hypothetical protein
MQVLQADPARRPAAAADVGAALARALAPRRRRPFALAASGAALALIVAGGVGLRASLRHAGDAKIVKAAVEPAPAPAPGEVAAPQPPAANELSKSAAPTADENERPRGKIKRKVVLKAVSDVKKLRAAASKSLAPKPVQTKSASRGGKKKALDEASFAPEFKEALSPPEPVGVQARPADPDAGRPPSMPPRK